MKACTSKEHLIVDALFGDIDAAGLEALQTHMATCKGCAGAFQEMQQTLDLTSQVAEPVVTEDYWDTYYERLQHRMAEEALPQRNTWVTLKNWLNSNFVPRPAYAQWGAALALVLLGIWIGRQWSPSIIEGPANTLAGNTEQLPGGDPALQPAALNEKTQQYLDRSKVLLLGLVNFDVNEDDPSYINIAQQQRVAGELVLEGAVLKEELDDNHEQQLSALVEELEMILMQIANLEMQQDVPSIELIQRGVDQNAILLKINLEKMKLSDQDTPEI